MSTKKINSFSLILALLVSIGAREANAATTTNLHSLWKVEGKQSTVYLFGSIHLLSKDSYPLPAPIESAFTNSQIVVFETDVEKMQDAGTQVELMTKAMLPGGETLQDYLSPQTYAAFTNHVAKIGLPLQMFESFKPLVAASALQLLELQKHGADPNYGVDMYFSGRAHKDGKQVVALETVDFQIDLFTSFSKEDAEPMMKAELKDIDNSEKEFSDVVKAWQTGDSTKLEKYLNDSMNESPAIRKRLLTDRTASWIPKIEDLLRGDKNAMVIVGTGHLVGKDGVVELLKKKGFKVTQE